MRVFGFEFRRARHAQGYTFQVRRAPKTKAIIPPDRGWTNIFDWNTGRWQQDSAIELDTVLTFAAVFSCIRLISSDIGKLKIKLMEKQPSGVWQEAAHQTLSPILRKPNSIQTRIKFVESWIVSKMQYGNTYVLKGTDARGVVVRLWVLDPTRVQPLISDSGDVFYRLLTDHLAGVHEEITVPARAIIHDVHVAPEHPLVGVSPIGACGLAATQGLKIQQNSKNLFSNQSRPSGVLTAPGSIADETAARLKASWETNFTGDNYGKTAVLGDGLVYNPVAISALDAQLIEQLQWTAEDVCRAFGVPAYKVGVGDMPAFNNIEALDMAYYSQTLQELIECIELLLDEGLGMRPGRHESQFDLDSLLRMDSLTRVKIQKEKISAGVWAPNEARASDGLEPVAGGESPYLQQQNYSLAALAKRDASDNPFSNGPAPAAPPAEETEESTAEELEELEKSLTDELTARLAA